MNKPIIKVAKPNSSITGLDAKDFALNTEYLLPKIYRQITTTSNVSLYNSLGYPHGSWTFRRLNQYSYYRKDTPESNEYSPFQPSNWFAGSIYSELFTGNEYSFFEVTSSPTGGINEGTIVDADSIDITIPTYVDGGGITRSDPSMSVVLFSESLISTSNSIHLPSRPRISVGVEGVDLSNTNLSERKMDSRLDTLKIFKTGLLTLSLPAETLAYKADSTVYVATVTHGLGYPPMYFPPLAVSTGFVWGSSADVYVDSDKLYFRVIRTSYGDDLFEQAGGSRSYDAETRSLYYTIFYNDISEEFNLLS